MYLLNLLFPVNYTRLKGLENHFKFCKYHTMDMQWNIPKIVVKHSISSTFHLQPFS